MVEDAERGTSGDKRVLLWEVRRKWDLDQFKAKANCQDRVKWGGGRGLESGKEQVCGHVLARVAGQS